jgi:hypothetical protein
MHIVECNFCEENKDDLFMAASEAKHCKHCHATYEDYTEHSRSCEKFHAHCRATTGRELLKRPSQQKKK